MTAGTVQSPLQPLIGSWTFEASRVDGHFLGRGRTTFAWIEDGRFVLQRAEEVPGDDTDRDWAEHSPMPVTAVIGFDDSTAEQAQLYTDARGVFRIYHMRLTDEAWTMWRDAPGFNQRFTADITDGGDTIRGQWQTSEEGREWTPDFDMVYRRVGVAA
jgi:hypothetical protein